MAAAPPHQQSLPTESILRYHALEFEWTDFEPSLTCWVHESGEVEDIGLDEVDFVISDDRACVGYFADGSYHRCPGGASVERFVQCPDCAGESFIPFQECVFEPRCHGEICGMEFCSREHILYLAFYGANTKIGMSSTRRIERRLIEQGADAYALVGAFPTRRSAREEEKRLSCQLSIPQALRQEKVLRGFVRGVDTGVIEEAHRGTASIIESRFGHRVGELHWLDGYPIELPLATAPRLMGTAGVHRGRLVGIKGKWLVYESDGVRALNLSDIPSRFLGRTGGSGGGLPA